MLQKMNSSFREANLIGLPWKRSKAYSIAWKASIATTHPIMVRNSGCAS